MLIINKGAFKLKNIRQDNSIEFIKIQISSLDNPIEHGIKIHTIPHRLSNDNINLCIKILPTQYLNNLIPLILLNHLFHHPYILLISGTMSIHNTIHF